jgi:hypothetical protein
LLLQLPRNHIDTSFADPLSFADFSCYRRYYQRYPYQPHKRHNYLSHSNPLSKK